MFPFERFTERARQVLTLAQQEAKEAGHSYVGTEHLLLGLLREEGGLGQIVLNALGVQVEPARTAIADALGAPRIIAQRMLPTSRVRRVIELSFEEAEAMGHSYVGTEHLLLGLLVEGHGIAARVLQDMGVTIESARKEIDQQLTERGAERPSPPPQSSLLFATPIPSMKSDVRRLLVAASAVADSRGSSSVGLDHLLDAMITSTGIEALARLLDVRRHAAAKEQAIASQDYDAAAAHRTAEREARETLDHAIAVWRRELEPPAQEAS